MNSDHMQNQPYPGEIQRAPNRIIGFFLHIILPVVAVVCGVAITVYLMKTSPEAKPRKRPPTAVLVEVKEVSSGPQNTIVHGMGEIVPAREIDLKPRVSGEVIGISREFIPGGFFQEGQTLLNIDAEDYALVVQQLESEAEKAESDLLLEMGNQRIAEKELSLLNEQVSDEEKALILRQPQLKKLQASSISVQSQLAKARLDLNRTEVKAPFNAVINSTNVNMGARVTESTVLAHLVGADTFWLKMTLPVDQLKWIKIPESYGEKGSLVRIYSQADRNSTSFRIGHVLRLAASLETQGRMAQLLVEIDDPLSRREENRDKPKLLLGSYVKADIEGIGIENGITINRNNIHDGSFVWLMDADGLLEIRQVEVSFRNREQLIIREGLNPGDRIITSSLSSPIEGIPLRLAQQASADKKEMKDAKMQQNPIDERPGHAK